MQIETIPIAKIRPAAYNPRVDLRPGDPDYEKLRRSIEEFDLVEPLVWNKRTGNLVGGHQRLKVLQARGDTEVEVSVVDPDPDREKALNIALNKISGEWDMPKLKDLLQELDTGALDMTITGFDEQELENLLGTVPLGSAGDPAQAENQYICAVECENERQLQALYEELKGRGFRCKLIM